MKAVLLKDLPLTAPSRVLEWGHAARIGLSGLTVHKFRAVLSMLGIIFGVASVVAVIAVSEGARGEVIKQLAAMGANNIMVTGLDWRSGGNDDAQAVGGVLSADVSFPPNRRP